MSATRELCKRCPNIVTVGFTVPNETWERVAQGRWNILCLQCFTTLADEMGLQWSRSMRFWPAPRCDVHPKGGV